MRILIVAYCFGNWEGQTLIGVYKRGLRLGRELVERGHEVVFYCTGREAYEDEFTRSAERLMRFVDIPFSVSSYAQAERVRETFRRALREIAPDLVVIGEAPLSGALLEASLVSVELGVPLVLLDNAYSDLFVEDFLESVGSMADGVMLMGPSSHQLDRAPPHLCQMAPFIDSSEEGATELLRREGLQGEKLVTVLAYDSKVARLGLSLVEDLCTAGAEVLFCARNPERTRRRLEGLTETLTRDLAHRVRIVPAPAEPILMALLEASKLAIVKYGFMQVAECLTLRTPVVVAYHEGTEWVRYLPDSSQRFIWVTAGGSKDRETAKAALRFLSLPEARMRTVHEGSTSGVGRAAGFLEGLPSEPRSAEAETENLGFTFERVGEAVGRLFPGESSVRIRRLRSLRVRTRDDYHIHCISCSCSIGPRARYVRLWGTRHRDPDPERRRGDGTSWERGPDDRGKLLFVSEDSRLTLEEDRGEALLPELNP